MTRIDLIPPELVEKQKARSIIVIISIAFAFMFGFIIFLYAVIYVQKVVASNRVDVIRQEKNKVEAATSTLKPYEERKKTFDERQDIVKKITEDQVSWSSILNNISMVIPNDVWISDFKADLGPILTAKDQKAAAPTTSPPIQITGYALDHAAVARWLVHLSEVNQFRTVWLNSSAEKELEDNKVIEFQTTVYLTKFKDSDKGKK
jgi:Tfp pilus assembly protein PilN